MTQNSEELAARVEAATGPDRELDRCLFAVLHGVERERVTGPMDFSPTASLDAAMTLVPEGWAWMVGCGCDGDEHPFFATLAATGESGIEAEDIMLSAATPALALCAAALRSRSVDL